MFNIGTGEFILIAVVALLVLGPTRLPEFARGIGKFIREFRRQTDDVRTVVEREFYRMDQEVTAMPPEPTVQPAADALPHGDVHLGDGSDPLHHPAPPGDEALPTPEGDPMRSQALAGAPAPEPTPQTVAAVTPEPKE